MSSGPLFIVLDGVDGCGKTTQAKRLVAAIAEARGRNPLHLREPGSTPLGEGLRALLLGPELELDPGTEVLLFAAARRRMLAERVAPALAEGRDVVCERFHGSTFAYQGVAGELGEEVVIELLQRFCAEPRPDLILILDTEVERAAARRGADRDRIEAKGLAFQRRVAEGFRRFAERTDEARCIDGNGDEGDVFARVREEVLGG